MTLGPLPSLADTPAPPAPPAAIAAPVDAPAWLDGAGNPL